MYSKWFLTDSTRSGVIEASLDYTYDYWLVALSIIVAAFASYTAFHILTRITEASSKSAKLVWFVVAALSMGCGIWAMHFVAMLAMQMPMKVQYEASLTIASVLFAILASALAFYVVAKGRGTVWLSVGAVAMGSGIGGMHYTGMAAMHMGGGIRYDPYLFALSVVVAVALSFVALRLLSYELEERERASHRRRLMNGGVMGLCIAAMHYTGMAATYFVPGHGMHPHAAALDSSVMSVAVTVAALCLVALTLTASLVEQALRLQRLHAQLNEESLNAVVEYVGEAIITTDGDGMIESLNPAAAKIFGYERTEIIGEHIFLLVPPRRPVEHGAHSKNPELETERLVGRKRHLKGQRKGGEKFDIDLTVSAMEVDGERKLIGVCSDVTAQKKAENALRESEKRIRAIMENVGEGIVVIDQYGRIESINPAAEKMFGYETGKLVGRNVRCLMPQAYAEQHDGYLQAYLNTKSPKILGQAGREVTGTKRNGVEFPISLSVQAMEVDGELSFIGAVRDITRRKAAEDALIARRDQLADLVERKTADVRKQAAQLAEALDAERKLNELQQEFVSMASHEFRTPLAIIDGAAQRIVRRKDRMTPGELEERVGKIRSAVTRMTGLVDRTLDASRFNAGKVEMSADEFGLKDLVAKVCDRQRELSTGHRFEVDLERLPETMIGDSRLLEQVFTNLLSNAAKYSRENPRVHVEGYTDGDAAVVVVRDNGVGIPAEEITRLFQRYFRASTSIGIPGTGIGLNLVKQLVELHGGSIAVESEEGTGSTFTVRLPLNASSTDADFAAGGPVGESASVAAE